MSAVNKAIVIGFLGNDPKITSTKSGTKCATFSVATSETWRDKATGERKEATDWHRVVVWNEGLIDGVLPYLKKGSRVYVEGKMKTRKWQGQDGRDNYVTEIVVQGFTAQIVLCDRATGQGVPPPSEDDHTGRAPEPRLNAAANDMDDEIPF